MLRRTLPLAILLACVCFIIGACAHDHAPRVVRLPADAPAPALRSSPRVEALAARLIADCLARPWLRDFHAQHGRAPLVRVAPMRVRGALMINVNTLVSRLETRLGSSGRVSVAGARAAGIVGGAAASAAIDPDVAAELRDQAKNASDDTVHTAQPAPTPRAVPQRADFVLVGSVDGAQVSLSLIHVTRNTKVWMGLAHI